MINTRVTICLSILFFICISDAYSQSENDAQLKFTPVQTIIHEDSISMKAETLPEFKLDPHNKEYQGNQISGVVRTVFQDTKGNFWFGSQSGLCRYNSNGLVYFNISDALGQTVTTHTVVEDKSGNIWIGYSGGIAKYDGTYFTNYHEKNILVKSGLWSMATDKNGLLWVGTTQGVFTFDGEVLTAFEIPAGIIDSTKGISTAKMIHCIMEDSRGRMWFGTNGGAYVYDGITLTNFSESDGLCNDFVHSIREDKYGNFWFGTAHNGFCRFDGTSFTSPIENTELDGKGAAQIFADTNGDIWFAMQNFGVYRYDGKAYAHYSVADGFFPFEIYADQQYRLWFVGFKGVYRFDGDTFVNVTRDGPW